MANNGYEVLPTLDEHTRAGLLRVMDIHQKADDGGCTCGEPRCRRRYEARLLLIGAGVRLEAE